MALTRRPARKAEETSKRDGFRFMTACSVTDERADNRPTRHLVKLAINFKARAVNALLAGGGGSTLAQSDALSSATLALHDCTVVLEGILSFSNALAA